MVNIITVGNLKTVKKEILKVKPLIDIVEMKYDLRVLENIIDSKKYMALDFNNVANNILYLDENIVEWISEVENCLELIREIKSITDFLNI